MVETRRSLSHHINMTATFNYLVYGIFILHGIGTLLPWNMFITANDFFVLKLNTSDTNHTETSSSSYSDNFLSYVGIASKVPNVAVQAINFIVAPNGESFKYRILASIFLQAIIFSITSALAVVDTSSSTVYFFYFTMTSVVLMNIANGFFQSCIYGVVARFPRRYMNALTTGMNFSGVLSSLALIATMLLTSDLVISAFIYFIIAAVFLIICFYTYIIIQKNHFFQTHTRIAVKDVSSSHKISTPTSHLLHVFKKCSLQLFNVFLTYFVALLLFPAVIANVSPSSDALGRFFGVICCFLNFNFFAMCGNLLADLVPLMNKKYLIIPVVARILFIPFFLFCNFNLKHRSSPVYVESDFIFSIAVALFALSSGYLGSLGIIFTPRCVESKYASTAGMMASFSLMIGITAGITSSFLMFNIV